MKTLITIIRHGETEWNVAMRLQGNSDSDLTERGIKQAELVAKALQNESYDVLISSDQKRAYRTAEYFLPYQKLNIIKEPGIRERNFGIMEGLTREEILNRYPQVHAGYMKRKDEFQIPEGESLVQFYSRVKQGLDKIIDNYSGKNVLLVTHGGVLDCIMRMTFKIPLGSSRFFSIYNASINKFSVEHNNWFLEEWGNVNHLKEINSSDEFNT